ncbi:MAG: YkgJ family cysteine cluster protein [Chlamydiia bacterium]|nr:YkgJ family cysteine cluster protein [Chlamydiia bacterium]
MKKLPVLPWYKEGLSFNCTQCGACCTGSPGYVWISDEEIVEMASFLKVSLEEFIKKFTRSIYGKRALREDPKNYDCVFLKDNTCTLYRRNSTTTFFELNLFYETLRFYWLG